MSTPTLSPPPVCKSHGFSACGICACHTVALPFLLENPGNFVEPAPLFTACASHWLCAASLTWQGFQQAMRDLEAAGMVEIDGHLRLRLRRRRRVKEMGRGQLVSLAPD